jgi:hypothetical protein
VASGPTSREFKVVFLGRGSNKFEKFLNLGIVIMLNMD